ncbi:hypothetical protein COCNU_scaffold040597G000010 [Cocos nucifera]|nr:hypothetical protein [Cocos nucifera]
MLLLLDILRSSRLGQYANQPAADLITASGPHGQWVVDATISTGAMKVIPPHLLLAHNLIHGRTYIIFTLYQSMH